MAWPDDSLSKKTVLIKLKSWSINSRTNHSTKAFSYSLFDHLGAMWPCGPILHNKVNETSLYTTL